jgi:hypothetical protein
MPIATVLALALGQAVPAQAEPVVVFHAERLDTDPALLRGALAEDIESWPQPRDYPAAARVAGGKVEVRATVRIAASGAMAGCVPAPGAAPFAEAICPILTRRARFRHALDRDGNPVPDQIVVRALFGPRPAPPPPTMPPRLGVDRRLIEDQSSTRMTREPDWTRFAPAEPRNGEVVVQLNAYSFRPDGSFTLICSVLGVRRDAALEQATCEALKSASFLPGPTQPVTMTLMVRWEGKHATVILPSSAHGSTLQFSAPEQIRGAGLTGTARVDLRFPATGTYPVCRVTGSAGSDAADVAACRFFESRPFSPPVDIFGRKVEGRLPYWLSFIP